MSWKIDPSTGDYVMDKGKPIDTDSLQEPVYYRIKIGRGRWLHAPDSNYGSDIATLKKKPSNTTIINMMQKATQPIIDDGRASSIDVSVDSSVTTNRNNAAVKVDITNSNGVPEQLNLPPVGD